MPGGRAGGGERGVHPPGAGRAVARVGDRMIQCPPLAEVQQSIGFWQAEVQRLGSGYTARGPRVFGVTPG